MVNNNNGYRVKIEKVLLCAGQDGYIPAFKPDKNEFGCLIDTDRLKYRLQVLVSVIVYFFRLFINFIYRTELVSII